MRLIDADKLIEKAYWHCTTPSFRKPYSDGHHAVDVEEIENSPTVDSVPVVRGHWEIAIGYDPGRKFQCSVCYRMAYEPSRYCPHCGAKMGERKDGEKDD